MIFLNDMEYLTILVFWFVQTVVCKQLMMVSWKIAFIGLFVTIFRGVVDLNLYLFLKCHKINFSKITRLYTRLGRTCLESSRNLNCFSRYFMYLFQTVSCIAIEFKLVSFLSFIKKCNCSMIKTPLEC
jgi:hypothetical protein